MSLYETAAVYRMRGLSDREFRALAHVAESVCGRDFVVDVARLAEKCECDAAYLRATLLTLHTRQVILLESGVDAPRILGRFMA